MECEVRILAWNCSEKDLPHRSLLIRSQATSAEKSQSNRLDAERDCTLLAEECCHNQDASPTALLKRKRDCF